MDPFYVVHHLVSYSGLNVGRINTEGFSDSTMPFSRLHAPCNTVRALAVDRVTGNIIVAGTSNGASTGGLFNKFGDLLWTIDFLAQLRGAVFFEEEGSVIVCGYPVVGEGSMTVRKYSRAGDLLWSVGVGANCYALDINQSTGMLYVAHDRVGTTSVTRVDQSGSMFHFADTTSWTTAVAVEPITGDVYAGGSSGWSRLRKYTSGGAWQWTAEIVMAVVRDIAVDPLRDSVSITGDISAEALTTQQFTKGGVSRWTANNGTSCTDTIIDSRDGSTYTSGAIPSGSNQCISKYTVDGDLLWTTRNYNRTYALCLDPSGDLLLGNVVATLSTRVARIMDSNFDEVVNVPVFQGTQGPGAIGVVQRLHTDPVTRDFAVTGRAHAGANIAVFTHDARYRCKIHSGQANSQDIAFDPFDRGLYVLMRYDNSMATADTSKPLFSRYDQHGALLLQVPCPRSGLLTESMSVSPISGDAVVTTVHTTDGPDVFFYRRGSSTPLWSLRYFTESMASDTRVRAMFDPITNDVLLYGEAHNLDHHTGHQIRRVDLAGTTLWTRAIAPNDAGFADYGGHNVVGLDVDPVTGRIYGFLNNYYGASSPVYGPNMFCLDAGGTVLWSESFQGNANSVRFDRESGEVVVVYKTGMGEPGDLDGVVARHSAVDGTLLSQSPKLIASFTQNAALTRDRRGLLTPYELLPQTVAALEATVGWKWNA